MKAKNFNFKTDWLTTASGIILLVVTVLASFNVLTPEQSAGIQVESTNIMTAISQIIAAVSSIVLMFSGKA
jgi:hypothetical protein